jgi:hypothetical protein
MEKQKYLEPKFSLSLIPLIRYLYSKGGIENSLMKSLTAPSSKNLDQGKGSNSNN